ncbi:MAG: AAA family ATPase [Gaiellales bacterium]
MVERKPPGAPSVTDATPGAPGSSTTDGEAGAHLRAVAVDESGPRVARASETMAALATSLGSVVRGKADQIQLVICALASGGHVLFDDVPGTAKTVLSRAIAQSINGATGSRIQCTPDLQPADVTGSSVYNQKTRDFEFHTGPIFANVVLLDEVNRATPKTQAALLEAMAERQVTVDGVTRLLPSPFLLLATENPIEYEGTFLLPEAELDRFFLRTSLGYPGAGDELDVVRDQRHGHPLDAVVGVVDIAEVLDMQQVVDDVYVDPLIQEWIIALVRATRDLGIVDLGASVRGSLALDRGVRAWALAAGRDYVVPSDVERLLVPVLAHRVLFSAVFAAEARRRGRHAALDEFAARCLEAAPPPA